MVMFEATCAFFSPYLTSPHSILYRASLAEQSAMQVVSASETTLIYTLEPLSATAFSGIFLREKLGLTTAIGAVFIIGACLHSTIGPFPFENQVLAKLRSLFGRNKVNITDSSRNNTSKK